MVPEGWREQSLEEICERKIVYGIVQAGEHDPDGVPYIKSSDVGGTIPVDRLQRTNPEIHMKYERSKVVPGDIIFSLRGNTGATSIVPEELYEANLTQGTARLSVSSAHDTAFVRFMLASNIAMRQVLAVAKGSTFTEVSLDALRKVRIPLPPIAEQKRIAEVLGVWDRATLVAGKQLDLARTQKRALMQTLLTPTRRFPGYEGQRWKEVRLGDVGHFKKGKGIPKTEVSSTGRLPCVLYGELYTRYGEVIDAPVSATDLDDGVPSVAGDVLIPASTTTTGIDLAIASCVTQSGVRLGGDINIFRPDKSRVDGRFLAYVLTNIKRYEMAQFAQGITIVHLKGSDLVGIKLSVPSLEEQCKIVEVLRVSETEITTLETQITRLQAEKKALMQQLLTGKKRI